MKKRVRTYYRIGYRFPDGEENCIGSISASAPKTSIEQFIREIEEEYGEKPEVWKVRTMI